GGLSADLALINGIVKTMNPSRPVAEAVAVTKNKIIKVGTNKEINQLIGEKTKVISLNGKTVVPGLIDTHIHVADFGRCLLWLDLTSAESIKELQNLLKVKAKQTPVGKWIIGRGWNQNRFKEKRLPNLSDLNEAAPDNPVILYHESAMICAVNSKALLLAGVTGQTAVPSGGTIDKNPQTGELTGILRDSATNLVWQVVPEPTADELSEATTIACQKIAEAGVTSVHWIVLSENELQIIQRLHAEGKLPIRVNVIVPDALLKETLGFQSTDSLMLRLGGVFIATDGYLDSKTAALSQPYSDEPNNSGRLLCTEQALAASVAQVLAAGLQPVIHAMGDKAIDTALKVIEQTKKQASGKPVRFRLEQAAVLNKELVKRLKTQGVVVSVQPKVIATEFAVWSATERLGVERAKWLHPLKTLIKKGVKVAGGSDCPMEPLNPLLGMQEAVTRQNFPEQRLTVEEALRMYTVDAAYSSCEENVKGSIEDGKLADLTILSNDPLAAPMDELKDVNVEMTIIDGKVVYSKH
ncbi:amidohydrolase, partial [Candidatus Bathyarchaeota archaeon]|nr:amidohydrolase [Candidatus Bathyarchaeota archaeon]